MDGKSSEMRERVELFKRKSLENEMRKYGKSHYYTQIYAGGLEKIKIMEKMEIPLPSEAKAFVNIIELFEKYAFASHFHFSLPPYPIFLFSSRELRD